MTLADADDGDVVSIDGDRFRLMIKQRGGYLCRRHESGNWGEHVWIDDTATIDEIVTVQPKRNKKARKPRKGADEQDPLQWKGTIK